MKWTILATTFENVPHSRSLIIIFTGRNLDSQVQFLYADNEDSHKSAHMRRLILDFVGRTCRYVSWVTAQIFFQICERKLK